MTTSGLHASYTVTGPATISGSKLTLTGLGPVTVTASQAGNKLFAPAAPVTRSFTVNQAPQKITFSAFREQRVGKTITLNGKASSGLSVTYSLIDGTATLSGNQLTFTQTGAVTIEATQAGNANFEAAHPVKESILVLKPLPVR